MTNKAGEQPTITQAPVGYAAAVRDWNIPYAGREMDLSDWNSLTIGEQLRYAKQECKTKGAIYKSQVQGDIIKFSVHLPPELTMANLSKDEAAQIERYMHHALEKEIAAILHLRGLCGGKLPTRKATP